MRNKHCADCLYFHVNLAGVGNPAQAGAGECRRHPPTPYPTSNPQGQVGIMNVRPPVNKHDQCGEWKAATNLESVPK